MTDPFMTDNIHAGQGVLQYGALETARAVLILLHGRGASAESVLQIAPLLGSDIAALAPQAAGYAWYPHRFLRPIDTNEPYLSHALALVEALIVHVGTLGIGPERVVLGGFSQGACLALESAARFATRFGGVLGFSGALIGPAGTVRTYPASLAGTPVFLGCSEHDEHIPRAYVEATAHELTAHGAAVTLRLYPGSAHTIHDESIEAARAIVESIPARA